MSHHTTHDFNFLHRLELDLSPLLRSFIMPLFEDLSAKLDELKQAAIDEHTEVMAALDSHQNDVVNDPNLSLSADQLTQLQTKLDDLRNTITHVYDATTPVTPPPINPDVTPTNPDVTPVGPNPTPTPNPNPTPGP